MRVCIHRYVCITESLAVHQKLTKPCKSTSITFLKRKNNYTSSNSIYNYYFTCLPSILPTFSRYKKKKNAPGVPAVMQWINDPCCLCSWGRHWSAALIPGPARWVKDPVLASLSHRLQLWLEFDPGPRSSHVLQVWPKKKKNVHQILPAPLILPTTDYSIITGGDSLHASAGLVIYSPFPTWGN